VDRMQTPPGAASASISAPPNTVIALADPDGQVEVLTFSLWRGGAARLHVGALLLGGGPKAERRKRRSRAAPGPSGIPGRHRPRIVSSSPSRPSRRAAPSRTRGSFRRRFEFEDLMATFLRTLWRHAGASPVDAARQHRGRAPGQVLRAAIRTTRLPAPLPGGVSPAGRPQ